MLKQQKSQPSQPRRLKWKNRPRRRDVINLSLTGVGAGGAGGASSA